MLFDIGIAGPIAGFVVAVPALFIGLAMSHVVRDSAGLRTALELGEPLLFKLASWLIWGNPPAGYSINMHPMAFAAWFGLLATALNLFPDRTARRRAHLVRGPSAASRRSVTLAMICRRGRADLLLDELARLDRADGRDARRSSAAHHPPVFDEHVPLDRTRLVLAVVALVDVRALLHARADSDRSDAIQLD